MAKIVVKNSRPKSCRMKVMDNPSMKSNMKTRPSRMSKLKKV